MVQTCNVIQAGCYKWQDTTDCSTQGKTCINGACDYDCSGYDECTVQSATRCSSNTQQTCGYHGSNCLYWAGNVDCTALPPGYDATCWSGSCTSNTCSETFYDGIDCNYDDGDGDLTDGHCDQGYCVEDSCVPDCTGLQCGPDPVCQTSCGTCTDPRHPNCQGGSCVCFSDTECGAGYVCNATGNCVACTSCTGGEPYCNGNTLYTCNQGCQESSACGTNEGCCGVIGQGSCDSLTGNPWCGACSVTCTPPEYCQDIGGWQCSDCIQCTFQDPYCDGDQLVECSGGCEERTTCTNGCNSGANPPACYPAAQVSLTSNNMNPPVNTPFTLTATVINGIENIDLYVDDSYVTTEPCIGNMQSCSAEFDRAESAANLYVYKVVHQNSQANAQLSIPVCAPACSAASTTCGQQVVPSNGCGSCGQLYGSNCVGDPGGPICYPDNTPGAGCVNCTVNNAQGECNANQVCINFDCKACTDDIPEEGDVDCGDIWQGYDCSGSYHVVTGTKCADPFQFCNSNDQCQDPQIAIDPAPASVDAHPATPFTVAFEITPDHADFGLNVVGWPHDATYGDGSPRTVSYTPGHTETGSHVMDVQVYKGTLGDIWGQVSVNVDVSCNPGANSYYRYCCDVASTSYPHYLPDGTTCTPDGMDPGETWWCQAGLCEQYCQDNAAQHCHGDIIYWYDSCGNRQDNFVQDCSASGQVCTEDVSGQPQCEDPPTTCTGEYRYECRGQEAVKIDLGCGLVTIIDTCESDEVCEVSDDDAWCRQMGACEDQPGTVQCGDDCIDPLTDRDHCGNCYNGCGTNEQCVDGMCELIPGCHVICDSHDDCEEDFICVNGGHCTLSHCEPVDVLNQNETNVEYLATELLRNGLVQVETRLLLDEFTFDVTNLGPEPLTNVTITTEFKKLIAAHANQLNVRGVDYDVLNEDPILRFKIDELEDSYQFKVRADHALDQSHINFVNILDVLYLFPDLLSAWNETKDALTIGLNSEYDGEQTTFHLTLNPDKGLGGLSVPLDIPKCMASYVDQMDLKGNYRVVKDDPLIVWQFDELNKATEITFSVPGDIDEDCKAQLKAMAIAQRIGKPLNPWLSLLLIPVIGILLIFFQRFTPQSVGREKLSKREFLALAKQQGQSDDDALREWQDYKRRF